MRKLETIIKNFNKKLINKDKSCDCRKTNMPRRRRRMQGRKCFLQGNNKNRQFIKNIQLTKYQPVKKSISTHNTTIKSKPNDKNNLRYKQATELSKLAHKLKY